MIEMIYSDYISAWLNAILTHIVYARDSILLTVKVVFFRVFTAIHPPTNWINNHNIIYETGQ